MDTNWLADLIASNESRSFSRTAVRRHLTQPAFSRRIRALELSAGAALFRRGPGAVTSTERGRRFLSWAETLRRQAEKARADVGADVRAGVKPARAPLRIAATHSLSLAFFAHWIEAIGGRIDLGPAELASESLTGCERLLGEGRTEFLLAHSHPETAALRPAFTSHHAGVLKSMALSGQGFAWLPRSIVRAELRRGTLVVLDGGAWRAIALDIRLFRPRARLTGDAEAFWAAASEEAAGQAVGRADLPAGEGCPEPGAAF